MKDPLFAAGRPPLRASGIRLLFVALLAFAPALSALASTVEMKTNYPDNTTTVNQLIIVTVSLTGSRISGGGVRLPSIKGLKVNANGMSYDADVEKWNYYVTAAQAGDYTIPGFDVKTQAGETLHVPDLTIHVKAG